MAGSFFFGGGRGIRNGHCMPRMPPLFSRTKLNTNPPNIVQNPQAWVTSVDIPRIKRKMPMCIKPNNMAVMIAPQPKGTSKNRNGFPKTSLSRDCM